MPTINRIHSEPPRDNTWLDYHREMSSKYSLLVRSMNGRKPYYTDASFDEVRAAESGYFEAVNCGWGSDNWNETPAIWRSYNGLVTEVYHDYNGHDAGYFRNGEWVAKFYDDRNYSMWTIFSYETICVRNSDVVYRWNGADHFLTVLGAESSVNKPPTDTIVPVLRGANAKKWRGFFEDSIEYILDITGIRRTEI